MTSKLIKAARLSDGEQILIPRIPMISNDIDFPVACGVLFDDRQSISRTKLG